MSYTALYRKLRPTRFEDVRGQDHIVKTLKNQLTNDRVGHAYLFCGTRGTGKTTIAKIFARAVNCEQPIDGSPCNECHTCRSIIAGSSVNVVEIDAASNNGVDSIREIREEVKYKPTEGRYRVYIIDEAHMLTTQAWNALLKTIEEPPEYVIFIFATTEVHKIPITILSRCQRYDFRRLSFQEIESQIRDVLEMEGITAEDTAVRYLARQADGSSRDALSLLEQCINLKRGETLTYDWVLSMLGAVDQSVFSNLLRHILQKNVSGAVSATDEMIATGRDLSQFVVDFTWYLRNVMLIQTENPGEEMLGISKENLEIMREEAMGMDIPTTMRYIRILSELTNEMRFSPAKRVLFELAVIKMMMPAMEENLESVNDRLRYIEDQLGMEHGKDVHVHAEVEPRTASAPKIPREEITVSNATYEDYKKLSEEWDDVVQKLPPLCRHLFKGSTISADEKDRLVVLFTQEFNHKAVEENKRDAELKKLLKELYNKEFNIGTKCLGQGEQAPLITRGATIPGIRMEIEEA